VRKTPEQIAAYEAAMQTFEFLDQRRAAGIFGGDQADMLRENAEHLMALAEEDRSAAA